MPSFFTRMSLAFAVPYVTVIFLTILSALVAVLVFLTNQFQILILLGAVLEAAIYAVAGFCVIRLRRRKREAKRSFRIAGGLVIPVATVIVFSLLGLLASLGIGTPGIVLGEPLIFALAIFVLSGLYVFFGVPRIRAAAAARRATTRRRPRRDSVETSQV